MHTGMQRLARTSNALLTISSGQNFTLFALMEINRIPGACKNNQQPSLTTTCVARLSLTCHISSAPFPRTSLLQVRTLKQLLLRSPLLQHASLSGRMRTRTEDRTSIRMDLRRTIHPELRPFVFRLIVVTGIGV
jgi:hypothetical protein